MEDISLIIDSYRNKLIRRDTKYNTLFYISYPVIWGFTNIYKFKHFLPENYLVPKPKTRRRYCSTCSYDPNDRSDVSSISQLSENKSQGSTRSKNYNLSKSRRERTITRGRGRGKIRGRGRRIKN